MNEISVFTKSWVVLTQAHAAPSHSPQTTDRTHNPHTQTSLKYKRAIRRVAPPKTDAVFEYNSIFKYWT